LQQRCLTAGGDPVRLSQMCNWLGLVAFVLLCLFVFWDCRRAKAVGA